MSDLRTIIDNAKNIVFFGGAGVSTESGIPDFRSEAGLYAAQEVYGHAPEYLLSYDAFAGDTELFFAYYKENLIHPDAKPNDAHKALAKLEREGKLSAVVTQNVDGLHSAAGSQNVFELHGSIERNTCTDCHAKYPLGYILDETNCAKVYDMKDRMKSIRSDSRVFTRSGVIPVCAKCGGVVKPDVVLYGEALDDEVVSGAVDAIASADVMIVGGTSLVVYPAAGFINYFKRGKLVLINKSETGIDHVADLVIHEPIGEALSFLL